MKYNNLLIFFFIANIGICNAQINSIDIKNGNIIYNQDYKGNRLLDYSYCGYRNSEEEIPNVENVIFISWKSGDNTLRIEKAIEYVSSLPLNKNGYRGAILLDKGVFEISSPIRINASGVVLRGLDKNNTIILKKGVERDAVIYVEGTANMKTLNAVDITSSYVPLNSLSFNVSNVSNLKVGDRIKIFRPSTKEWIASLNCDIFGGGISALGWKPGDVDIVWDRCIKNIDGKKITIDAPLSIILDNKWGKSQVMKYSWNGRITNSGIENITVQSDYDRNYPLDENHAWSGVYMNNIEDSWIKKVIFRNLAGSAVNLQHETSRITVEDCISENPISEIAGMRRCSFLTLGQLNLIQRCVARNGINDFAAGYNAAGPNAFVQCDAEEAYGFSGSIGWNSNGLLFDIVNIDGNNLTLKNLGQDKNGAGWNSMNSTMWQCTASELECYSPNEEDINRAIGCWGQFSGNGEWKESNNHVKPRSLFYAQLKERLGKDNDSFILPRNTNSTSSPTIEQAEVAVKESYMPRLVLSAWIDSIPYNGDLKYLGLKSVDELKEKKVAEIKRHKVAINNGFITIDGKAAFGSKIDVAWWNGSLRNRTIKNSKPHITRFVPGMEGTGYTDRIDSVVNYMDKNGIRILEHNYGLWYERRRDDHERIRRRDSDVWAPFYQQPFARSGIGKAWDGMTKYDLTRTDTWYWYRLKQFAQKGSEKGLLLFHENYFQHNILEAGAHWVDCPWRTANNINNTDFLEPVNFSGDKRIFIADQFYDITNPVRRELHKKYIHQCLENFKENDNVIQFISAEFTGPLHFVNFWLDVISDWKKTTGKHPLIALSVTKDVQDAVLNDPVRSKIVDIIDIRYWHYKTDGIYAPEGGKSLAPRQYARKMKIGKTTYSEVYKAIIEYKRKYPEKAVIYNAQIDPQIAWAILMGGGSCAGVSIDNTKLITDIVDMKPLLSDENSDILGNSDKGYLIYPKINQNFSINISKGKYKLYYIDKNNGKVKEVGRTFKTDGIQYVNNDMKNVVYWLEKL